MPKMIVVFVGDETVAAAEAIAKGARTVRFMEVDIRAASATQSRHPALETIGDVEYDGVAIVPGRFDPESALPTLFEALRPCTTANTVFGAHESIGFEFGIASGVGGIAIALTPAERSAGNAAEILGARIAKVAGWVRHGLGHEAEGHSHSHSHTHHHHS